MRKRLLALALSASLAAGFATPAWAAEGLFHYSNDCSVGSTQAADEAYEDVNGVWYTKVVPAEEDESWNSEYFAWSGNPDDNNNKDGPQKVFSVDFSDAKQTSFLNIEFDFRFGAESGGFTLKDKHSDSSMISRGNLGVVVRMSSGKLAVEKVSGGASITIDPDAWYHITLRGYSLGKEGSGLCYYSLYIQEYDGSGQLIGELQTFKEGFPARQDKTAPNRLMFTETANVDNLEISEVPVGSVILTTKDNITSIEVGEELQLTAQALTAENEPMPNAATYNLTSTVEDGKVKVTTAGLLMVDSDAAPQTVTVKATAGVVESNEVTIQITEPSGPAPEPNPEPGDDFDKENPDYLKGGNYYYNDCSTDGVTGALLVADTKSPNGTLYYKTNPANDSSTTFDIDYGAGMTGFTVLQADVRFDANGAGFTIRNKASTKGDYNTHVQRQDDKNGTPKLVIEKGATYMTIDPKTWYQITLRGAYGTDGPVDMYVQAYGEDGKLAGEAQKFENVVKRNNKDHNRFMIDTGTSIDNVRVYQVAPGDVALTAEGGVAELAANSTLQFSSTILTTKGEAMPSGSGMVKYEVYDKDSGRKHTDDDIVITADGLLKVRGNAPEQTIEIRATSKAARTATGSYALNITPVDVPMLELKNVGFNSLEDPTRLVNVTGVLNYVPEEDLVFVAAIYDATGILKTCYAREVPADEIDPDAPLSINFNGNLPADFNPNSDQIKIYTWTR